MIRHYDANLAVSDAHNYYQNNSHRVSSWLQDALRAAVGVTIAGGAVHVVERRYGRSLAEAEALALAWAVNFLYDLHRAVIDHTDGRGNFLDRAAQIGYENAVGVAQATAAQRITRLPSHASAQIPVLFRHLHDEHF